MYEMTKIAVILPCYNEEIAISRTIAEFQTALPDAQMVVCDNNSTDKTAENARRAGAKVILQKLPGKGHAMRRLFTSIEADIYVMADGDETYDAASAPILIKELIDNDLDMVIGRRTGSGAGQYRFGHQIGNRLYSRLFSFLFGTDIQDLFSGYRVMSRRFVKTFPNYSSGFEIETELNSHAALYHLPHSEIDTPYSSRPDGSQSKLNKYRDGIRILMFFMVFLRDYAPMKVFGWISIFLMVLGLGLFGPIFVEFLDTGLVPRFPTLIASVTVFAFSGLSFFGGIILQATANARYQTFMLHYSGQSRQLRK